MAKLELKIDWQGQEATKGIQALKKELSALNTSFSKIKISNDLTQQVKSLTEYYKHLSTALERSVEYEKKQQDTQKQTTSNVDNLRKSYANLVSSLKTIEQKYVSNKAFKSLSKDTKASFKEIKSLTKELASGEKTYKDVADDIARLSELYKKLSADAAQFKADNDKIVIDTLSPSIAKTLPSLKKGFADLLSLVKNTETQYSNGIFKPISESAAASIPLIDKLSASFDKNKALTQEELDELNRLSLALRTLKADYSNIKANNDKIVNDTFMSSLDKSLPTLQRGFANLIGSIKTIEGNYSGGIFTPVSKSAMAAVTQVEKLSASFEKNGTLSAEEVESFKELDILLRKLQADFSTLKANNDKLPTDIAPSIAKTLPSLRKGFADLINQIKSEEKYYDKGLFTPLYESAQASIPEVEKLSTAFATNGSLTQEELERLNELSLSLRNATANFSQAKAENENYHGSILEIVKGFIKFQASAMIVMTSLNLIRGAWQSLNNTLVETENHIIELQRVLPKGTNSESITSGLYSLAQEYGQSVSDVADVVSKWAKTGKDLNESLTAAEATLLAMNVAELNSEQATEGLVAIMSQFGYTVDDLTTIIDKLNKVADENPVTTEELLTALQKMGSYATATNVSLEESIALITTLSKTTAASGSNIGNALKSLFAYSGKSSSLDTFASLSDETQAVVDKYRKGGATILDVWRSVSAYMQSAEARQSNILSDLISSDDWNNLNDELEGELEDIYTDVTGIYDTAGTYRKNYFIALMNDIQNVDEVLTDMNDAIGYSAAENETAMTSYEKKLASLQAKWEEIANSEQGLLGIKKSLIEIASAALEVFETLGGVRTILATLPPLIMACFGAEIIKSVSKLAKVIGANLTAAVESLSTGFTTLSGAMGWISIAVAVISAGVGIYQKIQTEIENTRQANIDLWQSQTSVATELAKLNSQLNELNPTDEQYSTIQEGIIELLGERAKAIKTLYGNTDEYIAKIEEMTKAELDYYSITAQSAANASREKFGTTTGTPNIIMRGGNGTGFGQVREIAKILQANGLNVAGLDGEYEDGYHFQKGNKFLDYSNLATALTEMMANGYGSTSVYTELANYYDTLKGEIESYVTQQATASVFSYLASGGQLNSTDAVNGVVADILKVSGATDEWKSYVESIVAEYSTIAGEGGEGEGIIDKIAEKIDDLTKDQLTELLDKLKEIRNEAETLEKIADKQAKVHEAENDLEEKRIALLEAEKALQDALNTRSVQRFNSATGVLEWQTDDKAVEDAQSKVIQATKDVVESQNKIREAVEELQKFLMDEAFEEIYTALGSGSISEDSIWGILGKWNGYNLGSNEWLQTAANYISSALASLGYGFGLGSGSSGGSSGGSGNSSGGSTTTSSVGVSGKVKPAVSETLKTAKKVNGQVFDSGGIANGIGYMPKDVMSAEMVLPPDTTKMLLNPENLNNIDRVSRSLGLLFDTAQRSFGTAQTTPISKSVTDNRNYSTNGVYLGNVQVGNGASAEALTGILRDLRILS